VGCLDTPTVDALGGGWKRLIFCGLEAQVGMAASDSERPLEIERHDSRELFKICECGTIYSMWIILRKCEGDCEACLVRSREQIW